MVQSQSDTSEMSMEDILASIRKYVGEESSSPVKQDVVLNGNTTQSVTSPIVLTEELKTDPIATTIQTDSSAPSFSFSPFERLEAAIQEQVTRPVPPQLETVIAPTTRSVQDLPVTEFLEGIAKKMIEEWIHQHLEKLVTRFVQDEIDRLKKRS